MKNTYIVILLGILFLTLSCSNKETNDIDEIKDEKIPVKTSVAIKKSYDKTLEYSGTFFANKEANLGTSMPGKIEKFYYPKGTYVKKGTVLVDLSSELLTQALIEYDAIKKDYERIERLKEKGSISEIEFDHVKAKFDASKVKTDMLRNNTSIIAPFDGIIADYLVEEGENYFFTVNLEPGYSNTSGVLRLMQLNPLKVEIQVGEKDISKIHIGQEVRLSCDAVTNEFYTGKVSFIKPFLSTTSRTAGVEIQVSNYGGKIMPGMNAKVFVDYGSETGVYVPVNAVFRQPGTPEDYVYIVENDTAYRTRITKIKTEGEYVCVEGVKQESVVVLEGKNKLRDKSLVNIVKN
ncbi:MAG: efflux RND transporter periplasmic adaptor subunit [Bacteroidales bacterium]|nr:efflux RND transporter periplasmic adaptor subunit [Bacteroidales bacterium]MDD4217190.1 efflux RND transporter periplasmic adaptor subunit [Bacteroidales bacterium]MDY0140966.1 efflux RND transporter periplasmic adaptor subunit [Bacteroidales bacterium]